MGRALVAVSACVALIALRCDYKPKNQGESLYNQHCQSCHMEEGQGLGELFPPIKSSDYVVKHRDELACLIRNGISGEITVNGVKYEGTMAGNARLTEVEISNLVHYILVSLNDEQEPYEIKGIREQLENCKQ